MKKIKENIWSLVFFAAISLALQACRQVYNPELDVQPGILVVDGQVTNLNEPAFVKLSIATPYSNKRMDSVVRFANVMIIEDHKTSYTLKESIYGYYSIDPVMFRAKPDHIYSLLIVLPSGETYESSPQKMPAPASIDSMYGSIANKEYIYTDVYDNIVGRAETGVQTYINYRCPDDSARHYRFKQTLLYGYTWIDYSIRPHPMVVYLWKKINPDKSLIMTGLDNVAYTKKAIKYPVSFFPLNAYLYKLKFDEKMEKWYLQVRQYALTDDAFRYFKEVNSQLTSTGAIFDPIAAQISGNITCPSNPSKIALGFFEVSSCVKKTCYIKPLPFYSQANYRRGVDLDSIAESGRIYNEAPFFWLDDK